MYLWNTIIVLSKIIFYLGFASIAGYTFFNLVMIQAKINDKLMIEQLNQSNWVKASLFTALIANLVWFFASTGAMAESGIEGAFAPDMLAILWDSTVGDATLLRSIGVMLAILALVPFFRSTALKNYFRQATFLLSVLTLTYSFTLLGHISELGMFVQILLMCHVLAMAWWFGALYPLKRACDLLQDDKLYQLMETFGKQASVMVSILLFAGLWMVIQLVGSIDALLSSSYGQIMLLKLLFVIAILAIAAKHKLKLVPQLKQGESRAMLSRSIRVEMIIALIILSITAVLTSVVGPAD